jgi:hypothetical protein
MEDMMNQNVELIPYPKEDGCRPDVDGDDVSELSEYCAEHEDSYDASDQEG